MLSEGRGGPLGEPDITSLAALRGLEDVPAAGLGERAPDLQGSSFEVQVFPFEALQFAATEPGGNGHDVEGFQPILSRRLKEIEDSSHHLLNIGLLCSAQTVEEAVHELCWHRIRFSLESDKGPDLSTVHTAWDFDNLLGAMYLQMWWLMASAGDIIRCEFCGRIVSLARSHPEGRKRRRDKRFCDDACRQAYHRSKKKRQALGC